MKRLVLVAATALLAWGCDSSEPEPVVPPDPVDALVGTWTLTEVAVEEYATSSTSQLWIDFDRTPAGSIQVTGSRTGEMTYGRIYSTDPESPGAEFASYPLSSSGTFPRFYLRARRFSATGPALFELSVTEAGGSTDFDNTYDGAPFTLEASRLSVPSVTLFGNGGTSVRVSGSLTFPSTPLQAGVRTRVSQEQQSVYVSWRLTFNDDGTFRGERSFGSEAYVDLGTWEATADSLRLEFEAPPDTRLAYAYSWNGRQLVLRSDRETCVDFPCEDPEQVHGLAPGTLRRFEGELKQGFAPPPPAARSGDTGGGR